MRVIDLGGGHEEDYNDEIYDRRGGRGRSRRSDGTYMGYGGGLISFNTFLQGPIIDISTASKRFIEKHFLDFCWIKFIFECLYHGANIIS